MSTVFKLPALTRPIGRVTFVACEVPCTHHSTQQLLHKKAQLSKENSPLKLVERQLRTTRASWVATSSCMDAPVKTQVAMACTVPHLVAGGHWVCTTHVTALEGCPVNSLIMTSPGQSWTESCVCRPQASVHSFSCTKSFQASLPMKAINCPSTIAPAT